MKQTITFTLHYIKYNNTLFYRGDLFDSRTLNIHYGKWTPVYTS